MALLAVGVLALAGAACGGGASERPPPPLGVPVANLPTSKVSHVVVIVMENKEYGDVIGSRHAPYLNGLARRYAAPRSLYGIRHPSLPNYLAMIGGRTFGIEDDCTSCSVNGASLPDQLESAGRTWRAYMQGLPHPCFKGAERHGYAKKHDPFMYFDSIRGSARRCGRVVPYSQLGRDLRDGALPDFAFVSPDLCADTHDCSVRTGDRFLEGLVPALLRELGPHGMLIVTYDEGTSDRGCCGVAHGGRIATVVGGPDVRHGATGGEKYSTYSILRTIEDFFGVPPIGKAAGARPLDALFRQPPRAERRG
ncbi:MAG: phosphatidylinositol-3-phosphatase [Solirubrobacteraceae bacterium]|nr:phosphatidylinositol-3-phosphatase [Solirubrobacteraceae bacterium]